jgi:hypothetical protein
MGTRGRLLEDKAAEVQNPRRHLSAPPLPTVHGAVLS